MTQTVRLNSANTLDEVQVVKNMAIVAVDEDSKWYDEWLLRVVDLLAVLADDWPSLGFYT